MTDSFAEGEELSGRKKQILRSIIETHIAVGEPVGSKYLMSAGDIGYSSATIRNEMAELEEMGYLIQPHTSAGRVPTKRGYRFYIDSLMQSYAFTAAEINQLNNTLKSRMEELDAILLRASRVASSLTNYTTLAMKPGNPDLSVVKYSFMYLGETDFVIVVRVKSGSVKTRHVASPLKLTEQMLASLTRVFNESLTGIPINTVTLDLIMAAENASGAPDGFVSLIIKTVYEMLCDRSGEDIRVSGMEHLLQYPEFANADRMREVFSLLEKKDDIIDLVRSADTDKVNIIIGDNDKLMENSAIVFRTLSKDGKIVGAIGVLGPSRMDYSKVISTIEYLSNRISGLLGDKKT